MAETYTYRTAEPADLPRIVEIYNQAVLTREATCDLEPATTASREAWFEAHAASRRPIWVAENAAGDGVIGYLAFGYFMNERPGYYITADLAIYLHRDAQGKGLGGYLLDQAVRHAPSMGIESFGVTIFASNKPSMALFKSRGFDQWGFMPRVARLGDIERDVVIMGRRIG